MGRTRRRFSESRRIFEEVDDARRKPVEVGLEGPEETLTLTANAQPALMAVSLAAIRALERAAFLKDKSPMSPPFARRIFGSCRRRFRFGR
jgi:malonyl CoA-acyl carrier protein transacylase